MLFGKGFRAGRLQLQIMHMSSAYNRCIVVMSETSMVYRIVADGATCMSERNCLRLAVLARSMSDGQKCS